MEAEKPLERWLEHLKWLDEIQEDYISLEVTAEILQDILKHMIRYCPKARL